MGHIALSLLGLLMGVNVAAAQISSNPPQPRLELQRNEMTRPLRQEETTGKTTGPTSSSPLRDEKTPDVNKNEPAAERKLDQGND